MYLKQIILRKIYNANNIDLIVTRWTDRTLNSRISAFSSYMIDKNTNRLEN